MSIPPNAPRRGAIRRTAWAAVLVALAAVGVYLGCLGHRFPFDDAIQVERNLHIRNLAEIPSIFSRPTWPGYVYRPLPTFTYALTYAWVGLDPWAYHLTNIVLHALVTLLLFALLVRLFDLKLALLAALLFAVHPVHVEAVASVANRTELLTALLAGIALLLLVFRVPDGGAAPSTRRSALCFAGAGSSFLLALLAKESAIAFFLLVPLCIAVHRRLDLRSHADRLRLVRETLPAALVLAVATGAYFVVRQRVLGDLLFAREAISVVDNPMIELPVPERLVRAWALLGRYVALVLVPVPLGADYSLGSTGLAADPTAPETIGFLALATGLAALAVWGVVRGSRPVAFLGLWFFASFLVTANVLFPIGTIFGDRLAYLPSLGVLGLVAFGLSRLSVRGLGLGLCALLLAVLSLRTLDYARYWRDTGTLFQREVASSPSGKAHCIYGEALSDAGAIGEARRHFHEALRIFDRDSHAQFGLAVLALKQNRREEVDLWLARALESEPRHVPSLLLLGRLTFQDGRIDDAARLFVRALNVENDSFDAKLGILAAVLERDNLQQAAEIRAELAARDPGNVELRLLSEDLDRRLAAAQADGVSPAAVAGCPAAHVASCEPSWRQDS